MQGEIELRKLLRNMQPVLNDGEYVFCTVSDLAGVNLSDAIMVFKEPEGHTLILSRQIADDLQLPYSYIASWITLTVHSSLEAVGLTAAFSSALAAGQISCNVVAGYFHDHIFLAEQDASKAMKLLETLAGVG